MSTWPLIRRSRRLRTATVAFGAAVALAAVQVGASAAAVPFDRGIDAACDERAQEADRFADVSTAATHADAIGCLGAAYHVVQGRFVDGERTYDPGGDVTREQMASFVANSLDQVPARYYTLPDGDDEARFDDADTISAAHARNVNRLHDAGIVAGYADDTFRPGTSINRAQMASFIARALEDVIDGELPRTTSPFTDVDGEHQESIEKLTQIGVVQGTTRTTYEPGATTTRAQMATFIARSLDFLVDEGYLIPVSFAEGTAPASLGVTGVDTGVHDDVDRVTFTLEGDDRLAGWNVRYVDSAVAHGSGHSVDVDGDAILEVTLTGMALPPELDEDLWDDGRIHVGGDGIVEIVDRSVYEGQQQIFIGTTGLHAFSVDRLSDPQRVYIDVSHGS
jgi:hypothetical protein